MTIRQSELVLADFLSEIAEALRHEDENPADIYVMEAAITSIKLYMDCLLQEVKQCEMKSLDSCRLNQVLNQGN